MASESVRTRAWLGAAVAEVRRERDRLDAINVFPIADSDTGTNLFLTLMSGQRSVGYLADDVTHHAFVVAFARGCLMGARGNSGVILSQYLTALLWSLDSSGGLDGSSADDLARALGVAADAAYDAVGDPVEGTILTVARVAAEGASAAAARGESLPAAVVAAVTSARLELVRTTEVLLPARDAGVVDAGAAGLLLVLESLAENVAGPEALADLAAVEWEVRERTEGLTPAVVWAAAHHHDPSAEGAFEVMFVAHTNVLPLPDGARADAEPQTLKAALSELGVSVAVTGGESMWQVHVHTTLLERAIALGWDVGATQVVVRDLDVHEGGLASMGIVALTTCPGLSEPLAGSGASAVVIPDAAVLDPDELSQVVRGASEDRVILVAGTPELAAAAREAAQRNGGPAVDLVDSQTEPQLVAAVAAIALVSPGDDVLAAMRAAAESTVAAESTTNTIAADLERLLTPESEVAVVILGDGVPPNTADGVAERLGELAPDVEVQVFWGGQTHPAVIVGVEATREG